MEEQSIDRLVVGLGNPGPEYNGTRHNVGFEVLDRLAREMDLLFRSPRTLDGYDGPKRFVCGRAPSTLLVKPTTFMNLSGDVVAPLAQWAGLGPADILVVYDDMDLPLSGLRIRPHGGAGGHNGMRSIIDRLGSDRFPRLRVGIGRSRTDAARHVLTPFSEAERVEVDISIAEATEAILFWLEEGDVETCMSRFHSRWNQGPESPPT